MNYRELKKQSVKQWSRIGALTLTILHLIFQLRANQAKTPDKAVWILLILLTLITYYTSYYTLSSLFWPQPLSLTNHLLLIPCLVLTGISVYEIISNYSIYKVIKK